MSQKRSEPPSASIEFFKGDMISLKRKRNAKRFCNDTNSCLQTQGLEHTICFERERERAAS
jgi:hypothetical protein